MTLCAIAPVRKHTKNIKIQPKKKYNKINQETLKPDVSTIEDISWHCTFFVVIHRLQLIYATQTDLHAERMRLACVATTG